MTRTDTVSDLRASVARLQSERDVAQARAAALQRDHHAVLEQQRAMAEVLRVINTSDGDPQPVFEVILDKAIDLCGLSYGTLQLWDGEFANLVAHRGLTRKLQQFFEHLGPRRPAAGSPPALMIAARRSLTVKDLKNTDGYRDEASVARAMVDLGGARSYALVPLLSGGKVHGYFTAFSTAVRSFTEREVQLLEDFAVQAVIAIENSRLLGELGRRTEDLRESLAYQTATSEVLKVMSGSAFDLQLVLDTLCQTAGRLCESDGAGITIREGEAFRFRSFYSTGAPDEEYQARLKARAIRPGRASVAGRVALEAEIVHVEDLAADPEYELSEALTLGAVRSALGVPLLREGEVVGTITLTRRRLSPFSDRQIDLLKTFADQAVIAMENARLLDELREALAQQTATAEVLSVINSSPGDLAPVFDTILDKAHEICDATMGALSTFDGEVFHVIALHGFAEDYWDVVREGVRAEDSPFGARLVQGERFVRLDDFKASDTARAYDAGSARRVRDIVRYMRERTEVRSRLGVPLRKDGTLLGYITAYRTEVRPFSDKDVELLENFAAQAVIAMENARLLNEIRERQGELDVTFESMGDGVALFDESRHLSAWNQNFQAMLDVPSEVVAARPSFDDYVHYLAERGEYGPEPDETVERLLTQAGRRASFERTRPNGQSIQIRTNPTPAGGFVVMYTDITERKRDEEALRTAHSAAQAALGDLRRTQDRLVQSEKMASLGQLTAGIAHEIKNPLNFVNNFSALSVELLDELWALAQEALSGGLDSQRESQVRAELEETLALLKGNLGKIGEHGGRADNIVKSMLEHSRGGSGEWRKVDINALVDEALNLAYHGARAQDSSFNITLERDYADDLRSLDAAPQELTRVFLNLFGNAFYAASKRAREEAGFEPTLSVSTRVDAESVEVRVRDNGSGIRPELRERLFEPFFTTKPAGEGTGLGLSISYDIVTQQHGGTLSVNSEPGAYSEFVVRLPWGREGEPESEGA